MCTEGTATSSPRASREAIADTVGIACRLAGRGQIGAVHVVSDRRPAYDELIRFRHWADDRGLDMTVSATALSFRPHRQQTADSAANDTLLGRVLTPLRRFPPVLNRV